MVRLIDLSFRPVRIALRLLLSDKSTKANIIWATDPPEMLSLNVTDKSQITEEQLIQAGVDVIQPRISKAVESQSKRTKKKGEVFTPAWLCNLMNNTCDDEWFCKRDVFNTPKEHHWEVTSSPIAFPKQKTWKHYVDSRRLEITCGEAPYLVSRYDASTGEYIPPQHRIGMLDRKLRIVNENTKSYDEWFKWTLRAFQSVYGYEYQGDNLLVARINLLMTFVEYHVERWQQEPKEKELLKIANVIAWNLWQMDGLHDIVPFSESYKDGDRLLPCKIYDWRSNTSVLFSSLKEGRR